MISVCKLSLNFFLSIPALEFVLEVRRSVYPAARQPWPPPPAVAAAAVVMTLPGVVVAVETRQRTLRKTTSLVTPI